MSSEGMVGISVRRLAESLSLLLLLILMQIMSLMDIAVTYYMASSVSGQDESNPAL